MLERLAHRGPDGEGTREVGRAWLGQRHLAIVDPAGGAQPLGNASDDLWLVGDGEVYNHRRLRAELGGEDAFRTGADHEGVLHVFEGDGGGGVQRPGGTLAVVL